MRVLPGARRAAGALSPSVNGPQAAPDETAAWD